MSVAWDKQFAESAGALGLRPAKYAKEVADIWRIPPIIPKNSHLASWVRGCFNGTWEGRRAAAVVMLPQGGGPGHFGNNFNVHWGTHDHDSDHWSEGVVLVTSIRFLKGVVPYMTAAPAAPRQINDKTTYDTDDWIWPATAEYFPPLPVPGDTSGTWVVRSPRVEKPSAVLAAIAPMLLSEAPYPWKIDGGSSKDGSNHIELVRVDLAEDGTPPPTADLLRDRFNRLNQMAGVIEETVLKFPPGDHK